MKDRNLEQYALDQDILKGTAHIFIGKKGGSGKSFSANMFTQFLRMTQPGLKLNVMDLDPMNSSLSQFRGLNAQRVELTHRGTSFVTSRLDEVLLPGDDSENEVRILDMGSGGYIETIQFVTQTSVADAWEEAGLRLCLHTPLCGGNMHYDTLEAIGELAVFGDCPMFLWNNCQESIDGTSDMKRFLAHEEKVRQEIAEQGAFFVPPLRERGSEKPLSPKEMQEAIFRYTYYRTSGLQRLINIGIHENAQFIRSSVQAVFSHHLTFNEVFDKRTVNGDPIEDREILNPGLLRRLRSYLFMPPIAVFSDIHQAILNLNKGYPPVVDDMHEEDIPRVEAPWG